MAWEGDAEGNEKRERRPPVPVQRVAKPFARTQYRTTPPRGRVRYLCGSCNFRGCPRLAISEQSAQAQTLKSISYVCCRSRILDKPSSLKREYKIASSFQLLHFARYAADRVVSTRKCRATALAGRTARPCGSRPPAFRLTRRFPVAIL